MGTGRLTPERDPARGPGGRPAFPPAEGARLGWDRLPGPVRGAIERRLGARVATATNQPGGFSPGLAARVRLADGRRVFVKAVSPDYNPESPGIHRREATYLARLPPETPAPRLLWTDEVDGWVLLAIEDVNGRSPRLPWRKAELDRVLDALDDLSRTMTPAPIEAPAFATRLRDELHHWRSLRAGGPASFPRGLDPWAVTHLDGLAGLEERWEAGAGGTTLLHSDVRADNILLTDDRVWFVDWPGASIGTPWLEWLLFLPSVAMQGGPEPWTVFEARAPALPRDRTSVVAALAAVSGFFVLNAHRPAPPGLPTLRAFQRGQGVECLRWLRHLTGWR